MLAFSLLVSALLGSVAWDAVNPITLLQRALVFGLAGGWGAALAVFIGDLLVLPRGWCGRLCPVGAFYGWLGHAALLAVGAPGRERCSGCGACFRACPEPQVVAPVLRAAAGSPSGVIRSADCSRCGRCLDVCGEAVFRFEWSLPSTLLVLLC